MNQTADVLLARQPVYNRELAIWGYELLFRGNHHDTEAHFDSGDAATSRVLLNAFGEAGLEEICGNHPALINFTRNLILDLPPFDPKRFIIEILEDIEVDAPLIEALKNARLEGAQLALDDFILDHNSAPLIHLVDMIKVDVLALSREQIERFCKVFLPRNLKLLAEKVEDHDMFEFCKNLGFHYFQGYFLCRPQIVEGRRIPDNKMVVLHLLQELQKPNITMAELSKTISQDPILSYKLMKLVNSAAFSRIGTCTSLQQALSLLGLSHIKSWAGLIALGNLDDKPLALRHTCLERALFCQALGETIGEFSGFDYYTVGLFSLLDAFFDLPMKTVIDSLKLPQGIVDAIIEKDGKLGLALSTAKCFQEGRLFDLNWTQLEKYGLEEHAMDLHYKHAISKADTLISELK